MKPRIYLAGPISGLTLDAAIDWRVKAHNALAPDIACFSPLRCKDYLRSVGVIEGSYEDAPLSCARGIMTRDHWDCSRADLILVNLLGATERVSIGTVMEMAWGHAYRKPVVLVMEPRGNVHEHPMVTEAAGFRVATVLEGIALARAILLP